MSAIEASVGDLIMFENWPPEMQRIARSAIHHLDRGKIEKEVFEEEERASDRLTDSYNDEKAETKRDIRSAQAALLRGDVRAATEALARADKRLAT